MCIRDRDIKVDKKVEKVAKKNNVSLGKAALCIKLAEAGKEDYNKLCRKSINTLAGEVEMCIRDRYLRWQIIREYIC